MSTRLPAPARREQLLAVGLEVFARQGFHGTSMNDVADAAGVTKPVLYQHFVSKRELYLALLDEVGRELLEAIAKATAVAADGKAQTEAGFGAYFRWVDDDRDAFLLLFGSGARRDEEFAEAVRKVEEAIAEAIEPLIAADIDASPPPDPRPRARGAGRGGEPPAGGLRPGLRPGAHLPPGRRPRVGRPPGGPPGQPLTDLTPDPPRPRPQGPPRERPGRARAAATSPG